MVFDGKINMPDGEIYTAPVNDTLTGKIHFELPGVLGGQLAHDIRLEWKDGVLIHASASSNEELSPTYSGDGRRFQPAGRVCLWYESLCQPLLQGYTR